MSETVKNNHTCDKPNYTDGPCQVCAAEKTLLPCPFCGGAPILDDLGEEDDFFVHCGSCEVQQIANKTIDTAVSEWNQRVSAGDTPDLRRSETVSQCLRTRILEMMKHREWSTHWIHRSAYLHMESAELAEAVRGKRGDTLDESADVLITMLALSPHNLPEIVQAATAKVESLMTKPRYAGETGTFGDVRVNAGTEETVHAND